MIRNSGSLFAESSISCATSRWSCFCSIVSSFGTNFTDTLRKAKSSVKMECIEPVLIPQLLPNFSDGDTPVWHDQSPHLVNELVISACWGPTGRASLSPNVRPSLNRLYHSSICVMPTASSPKTCWIFWMISTWLSPSLWQNLMQYRCSSHSVIFFRKECNVRCIYTLTYMLAARDWRCLLAGKKSTYAHEGTLHLPSRAHHLCFISFHRKKIMSDTFWTAHIYTWSLCYLATIISTSCYMCEQSAE